MITLLAAALSSAAVPSEPMFPLAVGHRWTYRITEKKGAGTRVLFMGPSAEVNYLEQWTLEITGESGGRFEARFERAPVEGLTSTATLKLWTDKKGTWVDSGQGKKAALDMTPPPGAVSSDRVSCVAHYLGGISGLCSPLPGGPLKSPVGLERGIVSSDKDSGAALAQFLVGVATAGMLIPGNRKRTVTANLTSFTPGAPLPAIEAPLFAAWAGAGPDQLPALADKHGADAESLAAIVASAKLDQVESMALAALAVADDRAKPAVMRVAVRRQQGREERFSLLARTSAHLGGLTAAERTSVLEFFGNGPDREQAELLLSGQVPLLAEVWQKVDGPFDDDWLAAVKASIGSHPLNEATVQGLLAGATHSQGKRDVAAVLLEAAEPENRFAYLDIAIQDISFDSGRIEVLTDHKVFASALSDPQKQQLVERLTFDSGKGEARELLGLPPAP